MQIPEDKKQMLADWLSTCLSKKAYCKQHNIRYHYFDYWHRRSKLPEKPKAQDTSVFKEIIVKQDSYPVEILFPNGVKVNLEKASAEFIRQLVR
ncbi:MAG: hypothetical protein HC819_24830 [Cyclobacteriaceae bacterium]|jgi:hypothetical protein|nr:hypothetical protein [Cyclobacteriaceae bacterium]